MTNSDPAIARRMADIAGSYPDRPAIAFDADGKLMDWKEAGSDDWANGSHADERIYEIRGGSDEDAVIAQMDAADRDAI